MKTISLECSECGKNFEIKEYDKEILFCPFCGRRLTKKEIIAVKYMGTREASEKWDIPQSIIAQWCKKGLINGAEQDAPGSPWRIPVDAIFPLYEPRYTTPFDDMSRSMDKMFGGFNWDAWKWKNKE